MREKAREVLEAQQEEEFNSSYNNKEILTELFKDKSKEEIINYMTINSDYYNNDEFDEFKEELKREYFENRD